MSSTKELPTVGECFEDFVETDIYCDFVEKLESIFFDDTVNLKEVGLEFKVQGLHFKDDEIYSKYLDFEYFQVIGYQLIPYIHCANPLEDEKKYLSELLANSDGNQNYIIQKEICNLHNLFSSWCKQKYGKTPSEMFSLML